MEFDQFNGLLEVTAEEDWAKEIFKLASNLGFEQTLFAVLKNKSEPLENAYIKSNYSAAWRTTYDKEKLGYVDPTVSHTLNHTIPLFWTPDAFKAEKQKNLYEEASSYGLQSGIIFPIHGANGEYGMFSFASERLANLKNKKEIEQVLPVLSLLRDYVFESSKKFLPVPDYVKEVHLTKRELEILIWAKLGKSSWEIGRILSCSEATINFHMTNVRNKFEVHTRQQALVKAMQLGLLDV